MLDLVDVFYDSCTSSIYRVVFICVVSEDACINNILKICFYLGRLDIWPSWFARGLFFASIFIYQN